MPIAIADKRGLRLLVLCALYVAQGLPFGLVTVTLAAYLTEEVGADVGLIGALSALVTLPWGFKWLLAPLVDRFSHFAMGRRRPWILSAQSMMLLCAIALVAIPDLRENLVLLGGIVLLHNFFTALQDVAVDALAVDLLPENERGIANGLMYASSYGGMIIGGAGLSTLLAHHGVRAALVAQVVAITAIMMLPLLLREKRGDAWMSLRLRPHGDEARPSIETVFRNLWRGFGRRSPILTVGLALSSQVGASVLVAVGTILLISKLGWTQTEYSQLLGGGPVVLGLLGSVSGGYLADRVGSKRVIGASTVLLGATWLLFAAAEPWWPTRSVIVTFTYIEQLLMGTMSAALFALCMTVAWPVVAAAQFTAYMAMLSWSRTIGSTFAGDIHDALGTVGSFVAIGVLQIAVVGWLFGIDPQQNRRELGG